MYFPTTRNNSLGQVSHDMFLPCFENKVKTLSYHIFSPSDNANSSDPFVPRSAADRRIAELTAAVKRLTADRDDLRRALVDEDLRKIEVWTGRHGIAIAAWADTPVDPFFNVNTPEDAAKAEAIAAQQGA